MHRFSVIVPVFKVQKYIVKCLNSITQQTFNDFECIVIDDGSPDDCGIICDEYALRDSRIKVIHQKNAGLSSARNVGIAHATGEYLVFVDSDDYVSCKMLEKLNEEIGRANCSIVICGVTIVKQDSIEHKIFHKDSIQNIKNKILSGEWESWACNKCFKRELFDRYKFPQGVCFEDLYIIPEIFFDAKSIGVVEEPLYFYNNTNINSITKSINSKRWYDYFSAKKRNLDFAINQKCHIDIVNRVEKALIELGKKFFLVILMTNY